MGTALKLSLALLLTFALGLALAGGVVQGQQQGGRMAVDCEGNTRAIERECRFGNGQQFTVAIHIVEPLPGGYSAFQAKLRWNPDVLTYRPTEHQNEEAVWPLCVISLRDDNSAGGGDPSVLFGCVPFTGQENQGSYPPSSYTGPVILFHFACRGTGTASLNLVPREGDRQFGTHFLDENNIMIDTARQNATVECGGARVARPEPEFGPRRAGFFTPVPAEATVAPPLGEEGPAGQDGGTNGEGEGPENQTPGTSAGTPERTPTARATPSPETTGTPTEVTAFGDGGEEGAEGFPAWGWVVIGLAAVGGLGGAGIVAWLLRRGGAA